jgi:hypothetical protein
VHEIEQGLPNGCGFGPGIDISKVAIDIKRFLLQSDGYLTWQELVNVIPELKYLTPEEIRVLKTSLRDKLDIKLGGDSRLWFPTELST